MSPYPLLKLHQITVADCNYCTAKMPFRPRQFEVVSCGLLPLFGPPVVHGFCRILMIEMDTERRKCRHFHHMRLMNHLENYGFGD
jgi:hypothetical protein